MGWPWDEEEIPYGIEYVHALNVSDHLISNRKICIIDSGYQLGHPDLPKNSVTGYEGELSAGDWSQDGIGHGTHVAGTIAAIGGNNKVSNVLFDHYGTGIMSLIPKLISICLILNK